MRVSGVIILICLLNPLWLLSAQAQEDAAKRAAADAAIKYSQLEASGDFDQLYLAMHPDAQAIIPPEAVIGWYENEFAPRGPRVASVFSVLIVPWVWEVTGTRYPNTAVVVYRQPFADGTIDEGTVRLVQDSAGNWRWFFGQTREFVDRQIALYASRASLEVSSSLIPSQAVPAQEDTIAMIQEAVATEVSRRTTVLEDRISQLEATVEAESRRSTALETQVAALERNLAERDVVTPIPESPSVSSGPTSTPTPPPPPRTSTPTEVVITPNPPPVTATVEPVAPPPTIATEAPTKEAVYLDPRLLISDPDGHIGEFIYVNGTAITVDQYSDFTWVQVVPEVRGEGPLISQSIVVELRPPVKDLLSNECYRFIGTVAGTQEMYLRLTGATVMVPFLESSQYEPIPESDFLGCQSP